MKTKPLPSGGCGNAVVLVRRGGRVLENETYSKWLAMHRWCARVALVILLPVTPLAAGDAARDLLDLLVGEYNNHEQVWQQGLDGATIYERRHWRFERTAKNRLSLAQAPGQSAATLNWEFDLRADGLATMSLQPEGAGVGSNGAERDPHDFDTAVSAAEGGGITCAYRWRAEGDGFIGRATAGGCPEALPTRWRVTPTHLFSHHGPPDNEIHYVARRVRYYSGWVSLQRRRIDADAQDDDYILIRDLRLHDEGSVFSITDAGNPTGYALELARLTYQNTRTSVLKLGVLEEAGGDSRGYAWAAPGAERLGINLRWVQAGFTREE